MEFSKVLSVHFGDDLKLDTELLTALLKSLARNRNFDLELNSQKTDVSIALCEANEALKSKSAGSGKLVLLTSGTTGAPKRVTVDYAEYSAREIRGTVDSEKWILTYQPYRWAGVSVISHCLKSGAALAVPQSLTPQSLIECMVSEQVDCVSLTPSLFKKLVLADTQDFLKVAALKKLTFGGETVSQATLDLAKRIFPGAKVGHTYASTEFGDVFYAGDSKEGFPLSKLTGPYCLDSHGELHIGDRVTGDFWAVEEDRFVFRGRKENMVNVGGAKISLCDIEKMVATAPGVIDALAYAIPSAIIGNLVGIRYVGTAEPSELRRWCGANMEKIYRPSRYEKVDQLELTDAGKVKR